MYCLRPSGVPLRNGATWYSAGEVSTRHTLCVIGTEKNEFLYVALPSLAVCISRVPNIFKISFYITVP